MYEQKRQLVLLKQECPEYWFVDAQVLQQVIIKLGLTYEAFFRRVKRGDTPGFPRFKSYKRYDSFTLTMSSWKLNGKILTIRNVGNFKLFDTEKYPIQGKIKTVTVKRDRTKKWWVCFSCDDVIPKHYPEATGEIGIDVGLTSFLTDSNGEKIDSPTYYRIAQKKLRRVQRSVSRKIKQSKRREKNVLLLAKVHQKIRNQRQNFIHKISKEIVTKYKTIKVENLQIKNMVKNRHLSKSILDAAWGEFFQKLAYKAEEADREFLKVDPRNTSQLCSGCGELVPKKLSERIHACPFCGLELDRDHNAARNIKDRAGQARQVITVPLGTVT